MSSARRSRATFVALREGGLSPPHLHFHCVVVEGAFEPVPADGVVLHATDGVEATAITQMQAQVR